MESPRGGEKAQLFSDWYSQAVKKTAMVDLR